MHHTYLAVAFVLIYFFITESKFIISVNFIEHFLIRKKLSFNPLLSLPKHIVYHTTYKIGKIGLNIRLKTILYTWLVWFLIQIFQSRISSLFWCGHISKWFRLEFCPIQEMVPIFRFSKSWVAFWSWGNEFRHQIDRDQFVLFEGVK